MTHNDFMQLVASMRDHQKKYFAGRDDLELQLSKAAEKRVDDEINRYFNPTLF